MGEPGLFISWSSLTEGSKDPATPGALASALGDLGIRPFLVGDVRHQPALLPHDFTKRLLGEVPLAELGRYLEDVGCHDTVKSEVLAHLLRASEYAANRRSAETVEAYEYEKPFIFDASTNEPAKKVNLEENLANAVICLDELYGLLANDVFRETFSGDGVEHKPVGYYQGVSPFVRANIINFVNAQVLTSALQAEE